MSEHPPTAALDADSPPPVPGRPGVVAPALTAGSGPGIDLPFADRLSGGFVLLGALACLVRFGLRFPVWPDEAFLVVNIARRAGTEILEPLEFHQVAPPLFLLGQEFVTGLAGFTEWTLRLVPLLATLASLWLFRSIARRMLPTPAYVLAVAIFCVSYWVVRYAAEAKPYAVDLLVSLAFIRLALSWADRERRRGALAMLCGLALVAFGLSFPAVFVGGGAVVFMATRGVAGGARGRLLDAVLVGACLTAGFAVVYLLHTTHQMEHEATWMRDYWKRAFPPTSPGALLGWLGQVASGELMPYPFGGKNGASAATLACFLLGLVAIARGSSRRTLVLLLVPLILALVAAALRRYPFGAPTRCQFYLAPIFVLGAGAGLATVLRLGAADARGRGRLRAACTVLALLAGVIVVRDVVRPAKTTTDLAHRDFARLVWKSAGLSGTRPLCLREDLGVTFTPHEDGHGSGLLPLYLCNFHIYAGPRTTPAGAGTTVVNFRIVGIVDGERRRRWIEAFEAGKGMTMTGSVLLDVPDVDKRDRVRFVDVIEIMRFEPVPSGDPAPPASDR